MNALKLWRVKETTFKCRGDGAASILSRVPHCLFFTLSAIGEALKRKVRYLSFSLSLSASIGIAPSAIVLDHPESIMNRGFQDRHQLRRRRHPPSNPIYAGAARRPNISGVI